MDVIEESGKYSYGGADINVGEDEYTQQVYESNDYEAGATQDR